MCVLWVAFHVSCIGLGVMVLYRFKVVCDLYRIFVEPRLQCSPASSRPESLRKESSEADRLCCSTGERPYAARTFPSMQVSKCCLFSTAPKKRWVWVTATLHDTCCQISFLPLNIIRLRNKGYHTSYLMAYQRK